MIPESSVQKFEEEKTSAEEIAFDKAEKAESVEKAKQDVINEIERLEAAMDEASDDAKETLEARIEESRKRLKTIQVDAENTGRGADE